MNQEHKVKNLDKSFIEEYIKIEKTLNKHQLIIAFNKFFDAYYVFAGGNYDLLDAMDEKLDLRGIESSDNEVARMFLRGNHIKNTILSYNSIEDYMLQVIVFTFNLKGKKLASKKDFENKSNHLYYKDVVKRMNKKNINKNVKNVIKKYHIDSDIMRIREISNKLKHNNNIRFKGLPQFSNGIGINNSDYKSRWFEPKQEDLNDLIMLCIRANAKVKSYIEQVYNLVAEEYELEKIQN